jgi:hypothetical protein
VGLNLPSVTQRRLDSLCYAVKQRLRRWTKPDNQSLAVNAVLGWARSTSESVLENALLRQQLIALQRQVKRPTLTWRDRALSVLIASRLPSWKTALTIVQPDTLLRWHRELFRRVWRRRSRHKGKKGREPLADDIVTLIKNMTQENRTWGAERIRGELLKLGVAEHLRTLLHVRVAGLGQLAPGGHPEPRGQLSVLAVERLLPALGASHNPLLGLDRSAELAPKPAGWPPKSWGPACRRGRSACLDPARRTR